MHYPRTNRVLIALPDQFTSELMQQYLLASNFNVQCFTASPKHLGNELREHASEILILGADWGKVSGVQIISQLRREGFAGYLIIFAQQYRLKYVVDTVNARIPGFLHSGCHLEELLVCLREVLNGNQYITPNIQPFAHTPQQVLPSFTDVDRLSRREREVLQLIAQHKTNSQIAEKLFISPATVNNHRANIIDKLGLQGKHKLITYAVSIQDLLTIEQIAAF